MISVVLVTNCNNKKWQRSLFCNKDFSSIYTINKVVHDTTYRKDGQIWFKIKRIYA